MASIKIFYLVILVCSSCVGVVESTCCNYENALTFGHLGPYELD